MERKNKMVVKKTVLFCLLCFMLYACRPIKVSQEDMVGIWISSDGAELSLNNNKTFTLTGFDPKFWWKRENLFLKVYGKGTWSIETNDGDDSYLQLMFSEAIGKPFQVYRSDFGVYEDVELNFSMIIKGTDFPFYNKPPWIIGVYEDGPDGGEFYGFRKRE